MIKQISPIFWFWIPIVAMGIQAVLELTLSTTVLSGMHSENGPHEILEFLLLILALGACLDFFFRMPHKTLLLKFWFGLAAICCFYVAGEEISWGQHVWDWATPDYWSYVNDQQETNLHNTSSWLDQKPRLILELGIVVGTLVLPILKKRGLLKLPTYLEVLLPPKQLSLIALFVVVPQMFEKIFEVFDIVIFVRFSEVQELYMFYFVLLYILMLKITLRNYSS